LAQLGVVVAGRDAETAAVGQDEFEVRWRIRFVRANVDGEERDRAAAAVALAEGAAPGVEGRDGEVVALAEGTDGEAAALPLVHELSPEPFLGGIAGFAVGHG
jgi:hypothetical protein